MAAAANPFQVILNGPDAENPFAIAARPNISGFQRDSVDGDLLEATSIPDLWNTITDLGTAIHNNRKSITKYRNIVQTGLGFLQQEINQLASLVNELTALIDRLRGAGGDAARIRELTEQRRQLIGAINIANTELRKLLNGRIGDANIQLEGNPAIDPTILIANFNSLLDGLRDAQARARHAIDPANPAPVELYLPLAPPAANAGLAKNRPTKPMSSAALRQKRAQASKQKVGKQSNPFVSDAQNYYDNVPGANRRGGKMRKTKRHQKMSRKINKMKSKKTANKTAKKGKKMRGGYSYGKSKRRRGRSSPTSTAPSSLSSASKNIILF